MDTFYPLIIDGPAKGRRMEVSKTAHTFQAVESLQVDAGQPLQPDVLRPINFYTYHLHRFWFCGRAIIIASIHTAIPEGDEAMAFMWEQVITARAKEAAR